MLRWTKEKKSFIGHFQTKLCSMVLIRQRVPFLFDDTTGIDISGHTFLLILSNLIITSELSDYLMQYEKSTGCNKKTHQAHPLELIIS